MAKLFNRAKMTTATTGSGTVTLGSASNGFQTFAAAGVLNGDVVQYVIEEGANFEIGVGNYSSSGTSLTRSPTESSNSNAAITLAGQATVSITAVADDLNRLQHGGSDKVTVSSTGASVTGNLAVSGTVDGRNVASDGSKLDGIEAGATGDQTNAEIRAAVEAATDSNVFTDADHSKLNGIEANATADQTITAGGGLTGGGTGNVTISHSDTSSQASVNGSGRTYIQDITLDTYGHVTGLATATETVVNTNTIPNNATITLSAGGALTGGGNFTTDQSSNETITFNHSDTSSQGSVNNSGGTVIQDVTLDGYGHVTGLTSYNLDGRYFTETESDDRFVRKGVGYTWTAVGGNALSFRSNDTIDTATGDQAALEVVQDTAGADAFMQFHVQGDYAKYFGLHGGINDFVVGGWSHGASYQRLFHDGYHPNADKWTTARTLSLSGDASGSVSWDGSANATLSVTVANDSHSHSNYITNNANDTSSGTIAFGTGGLDPDSYTSYAGGFGTIADGSGWSARGIFVHGGSAGRAAAITSGSGNIYFGTQDGSNANSMATWLQVTQSSKVANFTSAPTVGGGAIWYSGNDGSGSGLDADMLDGNHEGTFMRKSANSHLNMNNFDITNVNNITINDPGPNEGISWLGGNLWKIYESPDNLTSNSGGNLQFVQNNTRRMTLDTSGHMYLGSNRVFNDAYHPNADKWTTARTLTLSGDASGSVSWDGSANATLSVAVADDSHNHTISNIDNLSVGSLTGMRLTTTSGYIEFGPANTTWAHIYTDRPNFYFNKELYVNSQRVYHTGYHPEADTWTTARTLSLSGDASGSVSWDGSANATLSVAVANDSHTHSWANITDGTRLGYGTKLKPTNTTGYGGFQFIGSNGNNAGYLLQVGSSGPANTTYQPNGLTLVADQSYLSLVSRSTNTGVRISTGVTPVVRMLISGAGDIDFVGSSFEYNGNSIFHDGYHPNADTLTTARTINGVSFNGSANITIADSTKLPLSGGTVTGTLTLSQDGQDVLNFSANDTNDNRGIAFNNRTALSADYNDGYLRLNNASEFVNGTYTPSNFRVDGALTVADQILHNGDTNTYMQFHAADQWRVVVGGSERLEVKNSSPHVLVSGDLNSTSDERLKKNIKPIDNALTDICQLEGVTFDWRDTGTQGQGFIAQQVEPIIPDVVNTDEDTGMKSINYVGLIGHLVEAIKEQQTQIDDLKAEIQSMKS